MKRLLLVIALLFSISIIAHSDIQYGYVKNRGTREKVGNRIPDVKVKVKGKNGAFMTDARGEFKIDGLDEVFTLEKVECKDYELLDYETIGSRNVVSTQPLRIVMVSSKELKAEKEKILNELLKTIELKDQNITALKKTLSEMADRLARVDYDEMDAIDREINECMCNGQYAKADSLIKSKGEIKDRIIYHKKGTKSLLNDLYYLAQNAILRNEVDSAIMLLEKRVEISPDNIDYLYDLANVYMGYQTNVEKAMTYLERALLYSKQKYGTNHVLTLKIKFAIIVTQIYARNFNEIMPLLHECLGVYKVPNVPILYEASYIQNLCEIDYSSNDIICEADSSMVSQLYSYAGLVYSIQGNYGLAVKCLDKSGEYVCDEMSRVVYIDTTPSIFITMGEYDDALDFIDTVLSNFEGVEMNPVIMDLILQKMMCYTGKGDLNKTKECAEVILEYFETINQLNHQAYHLALLSKATSLVYYDIEAASDVLAYANEVFSKYGEPCLDIQIQFEILSADILFKKEEYERCEEIYLTNIKRIKSCSETNNFEYNRLKGILLSKISYVYKYLGDLDSARECALLALDEFLSLYQSIGYEHQDVFDILSGCIDIAKLREDYMEEFSGYKLVYRIWKSDKYLSEIDDCYSRASTNPKYKKTKDFKKLKKEYKKFKEEIMQ